MSLKDIHVEKKVQEICINSLTCISYSNAPTLTSFKTVKNYLNYAYFSESSKVQLSDKEQGNDCSNNAKMKKPESITQIETMHSHSKWDDFIPIIMPHIRKKINACRG